MKYILVFSLMGLSWFLGQQQGKTPQEAAQGLSQEQVVFMTYFSSCIHLLGDKELIDRPERDPLALLFAQECYIKAQAVGNSFNNLNQSSKDILKNLDKALSTVKPTIEPEEEQEEPPSMIIKEEKPEIWI